MALALTILGDGKPGNDAKLSFENGVTLPGALFCDSDLVLENLRNEGVVFDVVDNFDDSSQSPV